MKASKDTVVSFHHRIADATGTVNGDTRDAGEPVSILLGRGQTLPVVEAALEGHEPGDSFEVDVAPEDAYGPHQDGMIQRVPKKYFRNPKRLKPGMLTSLALRAGGARTVTIHKVGMSTVDVDVNHPLAGKALHFAIDVLDVREATPKELAHGHAH